MTDEQRAALMARQEKAVPALFRKVAHYQRMEGFHEAADSAEAAARESERRFAAAKKEGK